jgi:hypothetical protein
MTHTFTPDYAFSDALIGVVNRMLRDIPAEPRDTRPASRQRGQHLPGVCRGKSGLYARFVRHVNGEKRYIHVATGTQGDFSEAEEQRLHQLWLAASAAWDREHGR